MREHPDDFDDELNDDDPWPHTFSRPPDMTNWTDLGKNMYRFLHDLDPDTGTPILDLLRREKKDAQS